MPGYRLAEQLASLITYLLDYPGGLNVLLGTMPPPDAADIHAMLEAARPANKDPGVRIDTSRGGITEAERRVLDEAAFNHVIERAGGWRHVNAAAAEWRKTHLASWRIVVDYARYSTSRIDGVSVQTLANRHAVCRSAFYKIVGEFPHSLAAMILNTPIGEFERAV